VSIKESRTPSGPELLPDALSTKMSQSPTFLSAVMMASSEDLVRGSTLERTEAGNRKGSWVRHIILSLTMEPGMVDRSISSRIIVPETKSMRRMIAKVDELLPLFGLISLGFENC